MHNVSKPVIVDLFVEDTGHEEFVKAVVQRVARELGIRVQVTVRSARGGHGRAVAEFALYQQVSAKGLMGSQCPDLVVVAIDCNCRGHNAMRKELTRAIQPPFAAKTVLCCPDPHIERWYLADAQAVKEVIGCPSRLPKKKCERAFYKNLLAETVISAGNPPSLGGLEFAAEIVASMDIYRAGRNDVSLGAFHGDLTAALKRSVHNS
ncbi:MAG: hypothetical protein GF331_10365 [Chitinivibrionales bacterium]|nr:hypothetical protein [Chitinivibrionales bacterium]